MTLYQGQFQPKIGRFANRLEAFNELCIQAIFVHMLLFTSWIPDPELQYSIGFSMIAIIAFKMFVNLVIVFYHAGKAM